MLESFVQDPRPGPHVCMLAYTFYETDGRVMRYAQALVESGARVDAIVLRKDGQPARDEIDGVRVLRIQRRDPNERGRWTHLGRLLAFFLRSAWAVGRRHLADPYRLIHVHSIPDFEVFAAALPKLFGAKVILDIHDIVPELYAAKFGVGEGSLAFKGLKWVEKRSGAFADHVIVANELWRQRLAARSVSAERTTSLINYPDLKIFDSGLRRPAQRRRGRFVVVYPGSLNRHQGLDLAIEAVGLARAEVPGLELHIYGEGGEQKSLERQIAALGLSDRVKLRPPVPIAAVARIMAAADLGVVPKRNDGFGGDAFSTKVLELMALGVPVVVAATRIDRFYFDDSVVRFFAPGDARDLARALIDAYRSPQASAARVERALAFVRANAWDRKKRVYLDLVERLIGEPVAAPGATIEGGCGSQSVPREPRTSSPRG